MSVHFSKKSGRRSSMGPKILAFVSHCSVNFQPILDCFIPNFKLKYEDSENVKVNQVDTVGLNVHQIKRPALFLGHPVFSAHKSQESAFWNFVKIFGWEWKVLLMKTKFVSKFFISSVFTSDCKCPKFPYFRLFT